MRIFKNFIGRIQSLINEIGFKFILNWQAWLFLHESPFVHVHLKRNLIALKAKPLVLMVQLPWVNYKGISAAGSMCTLLMTNWLVKLASDQRWCSGKTMGCWNSLNFTEKVKMCPIWGNLWQRRLLPFGYLWRFNDNTDLCYPISS